MWLKCLAVAAVLLITAGCDAFVEKAKYDALQKKLDETSKELTQAQQQVGEYQSHRYQMFREGYRTWRLDTVQGSSCIMLTVQNDWNKPETNRQSCACEDLFKENPAQSYELKKLYKCVP